MDSDGPKDENGSHQEQCATNELFNFHPDRQGQEEKHGGERDEQDYHDDAQS